MKVQILNHEILSVIGMCLRSDPSQLKRITTSALNTFIVVFLVAFGIIPSIAYMYSCTGTRTRTIYKIVYLRHTRWSRLYPVRAFIPHLHCINRSFILCLSIVRTLPARENDGILACDTSAPSANTTILQRTIAAASNLRGFPVGIGRRFGSNHIIEDFKWSSGIIEMVHIVSNDVRVSASGNDFIPCKV